MPNTIGKGIVEVVYDKGQAEKSARDAILPGLGRVAGDMVGVFAGKKIFDFAKQGFAELGEAEKVAALTASTLKATGGAANVTSGQVAELSGSLSELSGKDDELIQSGANMLLTFKAVKNEVGEGNDIFNQATKAALDLSTAGFGSMESASVMLGKALQDPVKGVTALQRVGVSFSEAQKTLIASLVATGDVLGAQKVILDEVQGQVGGAAKAYGETLPGQLERAQNAMDEAKASMVVGLAPALQLGASLATTLSGAVSSLPEPLQAVVGITALVGGGIVSLARPVSDLVNLYQRWKAASEAVAVAETVKAGTTVAAATATNSVASVSSLYTKEASGMISKLGAVGAAVGLAALAWKGLNSAETTNIKIGAEVARESTEQLVQIYGPGGTLGKLMAAAPEFARQAFDDLAQTSLGTAQRLRDALAAQGQDVTVLDEAIRSAASGQEQLNADQQAGAGIVDEYGEATSDTSKALEAEKKALEEAKAAATELDGTLQSMVEGTLSSFEAQLQLNDAQRASRTAIAELNEAVANQSLTQEQLAEKTDDTLGVILSQAEANKSLYESSVAAAGGTVSAVEANNRLISELQGVADTLAPGNPLKQQLLDYITKLQGVPAEVPTHVNLDTSAAVQALIDLQRQMAGVAAGVDTSAVGVGFRFTPNVRAAGGPVGPNELFRGAEQGFEILWKDSLYRAPSSGGFVMPHDQSAAYLQSLGETGERGGNTYQLTSGNVIVQEAEDIPTGMRRLELMAGRR